VVDLERFKVTGKSFGSPFRDVSDIRDRILVLFRSLIDLPHIPLAFPGEGDRNPFPVNEEAAMRPGKGGK
jgi:hypothetical protein